MKTSNLVLAVIGGFLLAFIVTMSVIFCVKGAVPDTLIQYTLGTGGVEALLLAGIKISKIFRVSAGTPRSGAGGERANSERSEACEDEEDAE